MPNLILLLLFLNAGDAFAQNYDASLISDSLKHNADAVKRSEELRVIIKSTSRAVMLHKYAVTVLNENGDDQADYTNAYDKMQSIESVSATLYDAHGKQIRSARKKDFGDFSKEDESLISDTRLKHFSFSPAQYPYTVEFEEEQDFDGIFFLPFWRPVEGTKYSVEQSNFIVETPADFGLRYKSIADAGSPKIEDRGGKKIYSWEVKNITAAAHELYQPDWDEIRTAVLIAPTQFEIGDYKGNMSTWLGLGQFINQLNADRQELPGNIKQDVHRLTDHVSDTTEKINALYNYFQNNTRYISIQLGIGVWQPLKADFVAAKKYGDCKALSNYMVSLLKEAGIHAKYVLVKAGDGEKGLWEDFPSPYFNHAIMCIPRGKDTTWLECTNQDVSAGYMGSFTGNRKALLIDDDGGHVVTTPAYPAKDNLQLRKTDAVIDAAGNLSAKVYTHFTGLQSDELSALMHTASAQQKQQYLNNTLSLPTYSVDKYNFTEAKGVIPAVDEYLAVTAPNYADITGKRLFIIPNIFNRSFRKMTDGEERKYAVEFPVSYIDVDTIRIRIPADYTLEAMPKAVSLKNAYGSYSIRFELDNDTIDVLRRNELTAGQYPKTEYTAVADYFNEIYKADRGRIVLVKNE